MRATLLGVPIMRTIVLGSSHLGNQQVSVLGFRA